MPPSTLQITITETGDRLKIQEKLSRRQAPRLTRTLEKATERAGDPLVAGIRASAPVRTGRLRASVSKRHNARQRPGVNVGPRARHRHWIIRGTRRGVEPNPFVARGVGRSLFAAKGVFYGTVKADIR